MTSRVTTSFQMDYRMLLALQKRGRELGFRSWGAYVRHMVEFHAVTFEPDAVGLAEVKQRQEPNPLKRPTSLST